MSGDSREPHELFDTSEVTDTPEHWAALAERIAARATRPPNGVEWLAGSRVAWIAAFSLLAACVVFLATTSPPGSRSSTRDEWTRALVPKDTAARVVLASDRPPALELLLLSMPGQARP